MKFTDFLLLLVMLIMVALFAGCKKETLPLELDRTKNYYPIDYEPYCPISLQPLRVVGYGHDDNPDQWEENGHQWLMRSSVDTCKYFPMYGKQLTTNREDANKKAHTTHFYWPF